MKNEITGRPMETAFTDETAFVKNPENCYAVYHVKSGADYHALRFASLSELQRDAEQLREDVHQVLETSEDLFFENKSEAEAWLRTEGFTVIPNDDEEMMTVRNHARQEAVIYLTYGDDCCWMEGCDTRSVEQSVKKDHYVMVYTGNLPEGSADNTQRLLEDLYMKFNLAHPDDFYGHSMSVSDIVVLKRDGKTESFYTDSFGFKELPGFYSPENALKNAEMSMEDDYGMIDGIINNGPKDKEPPMLKDSDEALKPKHRECPER